LFYDQEILIKVGNKIGVWQPLSLRLVQLFIAMGSGLHRNCLGLTALYCCGIKIKKCPNGIFLLYKIREIEYWQLYSAHLRHSNDVGVGSVLVYTGVL
jgi:hypothetical protein